MAQDPLVSSATQDEALFVRASEAPQESPEFASAVSRAVESSVIAFYQGEVVTPQAVVTTLERDQALQCIDADSTSCMTELAQALGISLVLRTQVATLGSTRVVTFSLIEADTANVRAQLTERVAINEDAVFDVIDKRLPELFGQHVSEPSSSPLKWILIGSGGVFAVAGGLVMTYTLDRSLDYQKGALDAEDAKNHEDRAAILWTASGSAIAVGVTMIAAGFLIGGRE